MLPPPRCTNTCGTPGAFRARFSQRNISTDELPDEVEKLHAGREGQEQIAGYNHSKYSF